MNRAFSRVDPIFRTPIHFMVNQRLVKLMEEPFVVVAPIETSGLGSHRFHTDNRNPHAVFVKFVQKFRGDQLLSFQTESRFANAGRPKHKNERIWLRTLDGIHQSVFGFHKPGMRHGIGHENDRVAIHARRGFESSLPPSEVSVKSSGLGLIEPLLSRSAVSVRGPWKAFAGDRIGKANKLVLSDAFAFAVTQLLNKVFLFASADAKKIRQLPSCQREPLPRMQLASAPYLLRRQHDFFLRTAMQHRIVLGVSTPSIGSSQKRRLCRYQMDRTGLRHRDSQSMGSRNASAQ